MSVRFRQRSGIVREIPIEVVRRLHDRASEQTALRVALSPPPVRSAGVRGGVIALDDRRPHPELAESLPHAPLATNP